MADDRTPRTISLTECPPDDNVPRSRKNDDASKHRRQIRLEHEAAQVRERNGSKRDPRERPGAPLI